MLCFAGLFVCRRRHRRHVYYRRRHVYQHAHMSVCLCRSLAESSCVVCGGGGQVGLTLKARQHELEALQATVAREQVERHELELLASRQ